MKDPDSDFPMRRRTDMVLMALPIVAIVLLLLLIVISTLSLGRVQSTHEVILRGRSALDVVAPDEIIPAWGKDLVAKLEAQRELLVHQGKLITRIVERLDVELAIEEGKRAAEMVPEPEAPR